MPDAHNIGLNVLNPTMYKPRLSISSLDIIIKLKTTLTTSQILNLTALSAQTSWMFGFCHFDDVITRQRKQTFGFAVFDNFFNFKNQSRYAGGFYDVKGTW